MMQIDEDALKMWAFECSGLACIRISENCVVDHIATLSWIWRT